MKGFTLIELLVVVLIVAILASVALMEYQKAVEKTRAAEAIRLLRNLYHAEKLYHITHGVYASALDELDFDFKGEKIICSQSNKTPCWGYYNTEGVRGDRWSIELEKGKNPSITVGRIEGPFSGTGFFMQLERKDGIQYPLEQLACLENLKGKFTYKKKENSYCVDVMDGTFYSKSASSRKYEIPQ